MTKKTAPADTPPAASNDAKPAKAGVEEALLAENKKLKEAVAQLQQLNARMVARLNAVIFAATAQ